MTDQAAMIMMLDRAGIQATLDQVEFHCPYRNAFRVLRIPAGPYNHEGTQALIEANGYGGTATRMYFDAGGKLIAIGAFE